MWTNKAYIIRIEFETKGYTITKYIVFTLKKKEFVKWTMIFFLFIHEDVACFDL